MPDNTQRFTGRAEDYDRYRQRYPGLFAGELHQTQLAGTQQLDWLAFRGQTLSLSVVPTPGHPGHDIFMRELRLHFDTYSRNGILTMATICYIAAARFGTQ